MCNNLITFSPLPPSLLLQEVKRRNISIVPSGGTHQGNSNRNGSSSSSNNQAPPHAYMSASSATSARAGLLSVSNPGVGRGGRGGGGGRGEKGRLTEPLLPHSSCF